MTAEEKVVNMNEYYMEEDMDMNYQEDFEKEEVVNVKSEGFTFLKGVLVGIITGVSSTGYLAYRSNRARKLLLKQLERTIIIAQSIKAEEKKVELKKRFGTEEVDLAEMTMENPHDLMTEIRNNIDKVKKKLNKKEAEAWIKMYENLIELTVDLEKNNQYKATVKEQ